MTPFIKHTTGELFVCAEHARISAVAVRVEEITSILVDGRLYISVAEAIEFHEESISERELIDFYVRALTSFVRGEWIPHD